MTDAQRFHELTGLELPENYNAADILNRMKEFCGEEKYLIFISWLCSTLSFSIDNFRIVMDFINTYILNPSALLRKAVEFLKGEGNDRA